MPVQASQGRFGAGLNRSVPAGSAARGIARNAVILNIILILVVFLKSGRFKGIKLRGIISIQSIENIVFFALKSYENDLVLYLAYLDLFISRLF